MSETACKRCRDAEERADLCRKEADLALQQAEEWRSSHRWLVDNGYAWLGDLELLLADEVRDDESEIDALERVLAELRDLRKLRQARVRA